MEDFGWLYRRVGMAMGEGRSPPGGGPLTLCLGRGQRSHKFGQSDEVKDPFQIMGL